MGKKIGLSAGTFDPFTNGHKQMIDPMLSVVDQVIVSIGTNPGKEPVFTLDERIRMILEISREYGDRVLVDQFTREYQVDYANARGANFIFRGLRNPTDFKEEQDWINFNYYKMPGVVQLFLIPPSQFAKLSSSEVKRIIRENPNWEAEVRALVPPMTYGMLLDKYNSPLASEAWLEMPRQPAPEPKPDRRKGVYISRFDPWTNLHTWLISRALEVVDELVIGVSNTPYKNPTFTKEEIMDLLDKEKESELIHQFSSRGKVTVGDFAEEHRVDFAARVGAQVTFRDLKSVEEFQEEQMKVQYNYAAHPEITPLFIIPPTEYAEQTSSRVKKLIGFKGWQNEVRKRVPAQIYHAILEKYSRL